MAFNENVFKQVVEGVKRATELKAGKKKAQALLAERGIEAAWPIYIAEWPKHTDACKAAGQDQNGDDNGAFHACSCDIVDRVRIFDQYEERTIRDIVSKVVRFGNISDKAAAFVASLLKKIENRAAILAQRAAEAEAAAPVPSGRVIVTGRVLAIRTQERQNTYHYGDDGVDTKVLIQALTGFKVWGNRFMNVDKGDLVTFTATITPSDNDPKFGFFARPSKGFFVSEVTGELLETPAVQTQNQEAV